MKKILLIIGVVAVSLMTTVPVAASHDIDGGMSGGTASTQAEASLSSGAGTGTTSTTCGGDSFLFMRPWYADLNCKNGQIDEDQFSSEKIEDTIKKIVGVVIEDILRIVGILAAGFLIYGGLQYAYSGGDTGKAMRGKKTITAAIIGMVIALVGQLVVNTFETIISNSGGVWDKDVTIAGVVSGSLNLYKVQPEKLLGTTINFVLAAATMVSVGYIIYAGVTMMISYGSPEKTAKARKAILYAIAGLVISMLAFAIVNFVLGGLSMAMPDGDKTDVFSLVNTIFGWIIGLSGFIAAAGIVVGGVQYITSTGDAGKVQKAKHTITYSVIGLVIVILAGAVVSFVIKAAFGS